jgi:UDP-3-O-[3-hydroxymyristoyl] glucosamine N-acyltransferase
MIGDRCEIHSQSVVGKEGFGYAYDAKGKSVRIPHQGRVVIEDDVHIGSCTTIDRATFDETRIGSGGKFDNQMHIAHNVTIGAHAIVTGGFMVAGSTHIGSRFLAGGRSTVSGHLELGDGVQISGLSAVTKSIAKAGKYGGHPLLPLQDHLKMKAALVHLAQMRRQLNSVLQKLGISDDDAAAEPQA